MADVTDGLDRDTLARYRAQLAAVQGHLDALYVATRAGGQTTAQRFAGYALGNATIALEEACGYLDQACDELPHEGA